METLPGLVLGCAILLVLVLSSIPPPEYSHDLNLQRHFVSYGSHIISAKKPLLFHGKVARSAPDDNVNVSIITH